MTDAVGTCAVEVVPDGKTSALPSTGEPQIALPAGTYTVDQQSAPARLTVDEDIEDLVLCTSTTVGECAATVVAENTSLFRQTVSASVRRDGAAVEGLALTLTGPGYRVRGRRGIDPRTRSRRATAVTWPEYASAPVTTDEEGIAVWRGWFVPGAWSVTAAGVADPLLDFELGTTLEEDCLEIVLPSTETPDTGTEEPDGGTGGVPSTPTTSGAPSTTGAPSTAGSPGGTGAGPSANAAGAPRTRVPGRRRACREPEHRRRPGTGRGHDRCHRVPPRPGRPRRPAVVDGDQVFVADEEPDLQTAGSTDLFSPGLVLGSASCSSPSSSPV